jgi:Lrp/AsnC family transcriptional regulator, leucine-responsive regulatory protein
MPLDAIDKKILKAIQDDSRITIVDLAARIGLSATPCARRLQRLETDGVIRGYVAALDQTAVGLPVNAFIFIKLERQLRDQLSQFEIQIKDLPEVIDCYLMSGRHDYLLRVVAADLTHLQSFLTDKLTRFDGIASVESSIALSQILHRDQLPIG